MAAFLLRNIAFCGNDRYNFAYTADLSVLGEYFQHSAVNRGRNFHYCLVILHFHDDIIVGNFVPCFDMHLDNFAFMQTFAKFWELIFKVSRAACSRRRSSVCSAFGCIRFLRGLCFGMAAFLLRNIAFCINDGNNFAYAADLAILGEHFQDCAVDWTRNLHYSLVILYFHYDIVIGYFVAGFDMHFDNFAFMQTFAQLGEPVLKFCHLNNLLKVYEHCFLNPTL
ncbi:hypothetical protein D3C73_880150 [compost metagenome]